jgi:hypothetical protein
MMRRFLSSLLVVSCLAAPALEAHEMRPAFLQVRETEKFTYDMLWKVPGRGPQQRLALDVRLPEDCEILSESGAAFLQGAFVEKSRFTRPGGLAGSEIAIDGLERTLTDALVRIERLDGTTQVVRLTPTDNSFVVSATPGTAEVAKTYTWLGMEHIWIGIDHLLFVGCLLFVAGTWKRILVTITGFTIAHSVTLALAALEVVRLPIAPVEATIALSIVFLAVEIARGRDDSLTYRYPIAVSSSFGLLHGFGFASVLGEIGLPQKDMVTALLFFNVGVEIGQVIFAAVLVAIVLLLLRASQRGPGLDLRTAAARRFAVAASYLIGPIALFWVIERMMP